MPRSRRLLNWFVLIVIFSLPVFFQNCSGFVADPSIANLDSSAIGTGAPTPTPTSSATPSPTPSISTTPSPTPSPTGSIAGSGCSDSIGLLCDDFESGAVDKTVWTQHTSGGGTIAVDNTHVYDGKYALHVHINSTAGSEAMLYETKTYPTTALVMYGRAMVYVANVTPEEHSDFLNEFAPSTGTIEYGIMGNQHDIATHWYTNGSEKGLDAAPEPINKWFCLEWNFNGGTGSIMVWQDGTLLNNGTFTGINKETFNMFDIGLEIYENDTANSANGYDYWYDDIELSTTRVGCPVAAP